MNFKSIGLALLFSTSSIAAAASECGLPMRTRDAGSRSYGYNCVSNLKKIDMLYHDVETSKMYFIVPHIADETAKNVEFVIRDADDKLIYLKEYQTNGLEIIEVDLPPRNDNENHYWYFTLICDSEQRSRDHVTEGIL